MIKDVVKPTTLSCALERATNQHDAGGDDHRARILVIDENATLLDIIHWIPTSDANGASKALDALAASTCSADIYLVKSVRLHELQAHVENLYRGTHITAIPDRVMPWRFHYSERKLITPSGIEIGLTHLEAAFINIIARAVAQPVKRQHIIATAFGQNPLTYDTRRLEAIVSRLRKKIHKKYPLSQPIKAVHAVGYMFSGSIEC